MDPVEALRRALGAVEEANLPPDLREVGFAKAFDLLVGIGAPAGGEGPARVVGAGAPAEIVSQQGPEAFAKIAAYLGITDESVARLFDEHDGVLQFVGATEKLGSTKAAKVGSIVVLLATARQQGGYDQGATLDTVVRTELNRQGLLDVGNYSKHLKLVKPYLNTNGSGRAMSHKAKYEAKQRARDLASTLLAD